MRSFVFLIFSFCFISFAQTSQFNQVNSGTFSASSDFKIKETNSLSESKRVKLLNPVFELVNDNLNNIQPGLTTLFKIYSFKADEKNFQKMCELYFGDNSVYEDGSVSTITLTLEKESEVSLMSFDGSKFEAQLHKGEGELKKVSSIICQDSDPEIVPKFEYENYTFNVGFEPGYEILPQIYLPTKDKTNQGKIENENKNNIQNEIKEPVINKQRGFNEVLGNDFFNSNGFWYFKGTRVPLLLNIANVKYEKDIAVLLDQSGSFHPLLERSVWSLFAIKKLNPKSKIYIYGMGKDGSQIGIINKGECFEFNECLNRLFKFISFDDEITFETIAPKLNSEASFPNKDYDDCIMPSLKNAQLLQNISKIIVISDGLFDELESPYFGTSALALSDNIKYIQTQTERLNKLWLWQKKDKETIIDAIKYKIEYFFKHLSDIENEYGQLYEDELNQIRFYALEFEENSEFNEFQEWIDSVEYLSKNYQEIYLDKDRRKIYLNDFYKKLRSKCTKCDFYIFRSEQDEDEQKLIEEYLNKGPLY